MKKRQVYVSYRRGVGPLLRVIESLFGVVYYLKITLFGQIKVAPRVNPSLTIQLVMDGFFCTQMEVLTMKSFKRWQRLPLDFNNRI